MGWAPGPSGAELQPGSVHVWKAVLNPNADSSLLSPEERRRAERFVRDEDRTRWVASRGILRELLGRYLGIDPRELRFTVTEHGKPSLGGELQPHLRFNLSHSGDRALYAISDGPEVGVDVECAGRTGDMLKVARRMFGAEEERRLRSLEADQREYEFLRSWARHEAAVKCRGGGIGASSATDGPPLWIVDLDVDPSAAGAVAASSTPAELRLFEWGGP